MALGGGTFTSMNKKLPGSYINFISASNASSALSDRGIAAMAFNLDWGKDDEVFTVSIDDFQKNAQVIFGYDYSHPKLKGLRDLFLNIRTLHAFKLNSNGVKASNTFATAKCAGVRGNDLKIVIQKNVDDTTKFDVMTFLGTIKVDTQTVTKASELIDNEYVSFKTSATLAVTASTPLSGGTNGDEITSANHQAFLNKIESYSFNTIGVVSEDKAINQLYSQFAKRMRNEYGVKFQSVTWNNASDDESNINVKNEIVVEDGFNKASAVYWTTGVQAGCEINESCQNTVYDGEFKIKTNYTQAELELAIDNGEFVFHKVADDVRVLDDINSLVTTTDEKGDIFKSNQTIRVIDNIGNNIATLFNTKYLGKIPNDASGRVSLWSDVVNIFNELNTIRAIENFDSENVVVEIGNTKKDVIVTVNEIEIVGVMGKLYMTNTIQ